jgi:GMP synthase (glutamine-hydrolysing)
MAGRTALVVRHITFEGLGTLEPALVARGRRPLIVDSRSAELGRIDPLAPDLVVLLGGPAGVYTANLTRGIWPGRGRLR